MLSSYLRTSIRNILRNKVQSAISILGMGIGFGCIILLMALIAHEKSFNKFIPNHANVYRVLFGTNTQTPMPLAEEMKKDFPEVRDYFRFYQTHNINLKNQNNDPVLEENFGFADNSLFSVLNIRFRSGIAPVALNEIAISEKCARKYFGQVSPLGAIIPIRFIDTYEDMVVTGVYRDFPSTSVIEPHFIAPLILSEKIISRFQRNLGAYGRESQEKPGWKDNEFLTMVVLDKNNDKEALSGKMEKYKEFSGNETTKEWKYVFQPAAEIYLKSEGLSALPFVRTGNKSELIYYEAISVLILLISVLNYILLTRASTSDRLKELGTRKAYGAVQSSLRQQIVIESNMVALLSIIPASFVIDYGMAFINETLNKTLNYEIFSNPVMLLIFASVVIFTGTFSGILIGYNYSRIPCLALLAGKVSDNSKTSRWAYSFLVLHFSIYIFLISGVITLSKQLKYSMNNMVGINPENVIVSDLNTDELKKNFQAISDEIRSLPGVIGTAGGSFIPPFGNFLPITLAQPDGEKQRFDGLIMGEGLTELLGMEIIDGSAFGPYQTDRIEVLINESSAKKFNIRAGDRYLSFYIRGVLRDFNAHSLHSEIQPMVILQQNPAKMGLIAVKTDGTNDQNIIKSLRDLYGKFAPDEIFEPVYLTDNVKRFYSRERNQAKIIGAFSVLASILSIMGLFGIALISISKRTKEVGIRKVNGSKTSEVLYLLNGDFLKWVAIAAVIAIPASVFMLNKWLERFAYKTELSWWIFAVASLSAVLIALITVSWQSWMAATRNPVEALRYE